MKRDYQIAGHRIRIEGCEAWVQAVSSLDGFKPFEVEVEGVAVANFLYTDEEAPEMTEAQYESGVDGIVDVFGGIVVLYNLILYDSHAGLLCCMLCKSYFLLF